MSTSAEPKNNKDSDDCNVVLDKTEVNNLENDNVKCNTINKNKEISNEMSAEQTNNEDNKMPPKVDGIDNQDDCMIILDEVLEVNNLENDNSESSTINKNCEKFSNKMSVEPPMDESNQERPPKEDASDVQCDDGMIVLDEIYDEDDRNEEVRPKNILKISFKEKKHYDFMANPLISFIKDIMKSKEIHVDIVENEIELNINFIENKPDIFMIDKKPSANEREQKEIPRYRTAIKNILQQNSNKNDTEDVSTICKRPKNGCFNCNGDHGLKDCSEPRNFSKINKARKMFTTKQERYHVDIEQRFGHLRPGHISDTLRTALGLRRKELPLHIYRMRVLGYPPGWLEDARVSHSGITLFDSRGKEVLESDEEDGEVDIEKDKYDVKKFINFPGFNTDPHSDIYDQTRIYGVPPMMPHQRLEVMIEQLGQNVVTAYKQKKLKREKSLDDSLTDDILELEMAEENITEKDHSNNMTPEKSSKPSSVHGPSTPSFRNGTISTVQGTPLLTSVSPFSKLPNGEQWSKGVSDVINYENLPDSTGKYEKMKTVIKKVRTLVNQVQENQ